MHPLTMLLKIAAEAARASTPQGSTTNQVANGIKQGVAFLDSLAADTPAKQTQALASLLSEAAYTSSNSDKERFGLTIGNALLLALEGAQYMQSASQPAYNKATVDTPPWVQAYQQQSAQFSSELQRLMRERQELQRQREEQQRAETLRLQQELEALRQQIAFLRHK